jgi:hypothetical protein
MCLVPGDPTPTPGWTPCLKQRGYRRYYKASDQSQYDFDLETIGLKSLPLSKMGPFPFQSRISPRENDTLDLL